MELSIVMIVIAAAWGCDSSSLLPKPATQASATPTDQATPSQISFAGGDGSSFESAVIIKGAKDAADFLAGESCWIGRAHPYSWKDSHSTEIRDAKRYDLIAISVQTEAKVETKTIHFDVTDFFEQFAASRPTKEEAAVNEAWRRVHRAEDRRLEAMGIEMALLEEFRSTHTAIARRITARFPESTEKWEVTVITISDWPSAKPEDRRETVEYVHTRLAWIMGRMGHGNGFALIIKNDAEQVIGGYPDDKGAMWWKE